MVPALIGSLPLYLAHWWVDTVAFCMCHPRRLQWSLAPPAGWPRALLLLCSLVLTPRMHWTRLASCRRGSALLSRCASLDGRVHVGSMVEQWVHVGSMTQQWATSLNIDSMSLVVTHGGWEFTLELNELRCSGHTPTRWVKQTAAALVVSSRPA